MRGFEVGDRVRIDIPDESDPDHDRLHGKHGRITEVLRDDAARVTNDERDAVLYRVGLESGERVDVRQRDVRPPLADD
jgi:ribosomal protein L21E